MAAPRSIVGEWVHAHERDHDRKQVFVSAATALPPSRGRRRLQLLPDGTFKELRPGIDDRTVAAAGAYTWDGQHLRLNFADGSSKPLGDGWEYSVEKRALPNPPHAPWESHTGLSTTYNAMIAPLGPLGLKGVAWYQGESDVGVPGYQARLAALMSSWRRQFADAKLPFLIISLSSFGKSSPAPVASGWAEVIDQQRRAALADPYAALVVSTDLGDAGDLHPPNKLDVGKRAALAARKIAYGENLLAGPIPPSATRHGTGITIAFAGSKSLYSMGGEPVGFELCGDTQESCRYARASLYPNEAVVELELDGKPATVERVDYTLRGTPAAPGHHRLEYHYQPTSWRIGWILTLLTLTALAGALLIERRRRRASGLDDPTR